LSLLTTVNTLRYITDHPLNKNRKAAALLAFLKWQAGIRLVSGPVVYQWIGTARFVVGKGDVGITQNVYCGLHDFSEMGYALHVLRPDDLFVDIGANVGSYTVLASAVKGARNYCFEPVPSIFARLLDNIAINKLAANVTAFNMGLSSEDGQLRFTTDLESGNHVIATDEESLPSIMVPVRTLDSVLSGESPSMLKMSSSTRYGSAEEEVIRLLKEYEFSLYEYEPFSRQLRPLNGKSQTGPNTLFLRNEAHIRERLAQSPRISVGWAEF
jgi:FkbM family methyltransferase